MAYTAFKARKHRLCHALQGGLHLVTATCLLIWPCLSSDCRRTSR